MAEYKDQKYLHPSSDPALFAVKHSAGTRPVNAGIYRCTACGNEIATQKGTALPSHEHEGEKKVDWQWQLIVRAEQLR